MPFMVRTSMTPDMIGTVHVFFHKKLGIWASTGSLLKLSDFEYSEFLTFEFLKTFIPTFMFTTCSLINITQQAYFPSTGVS